MVPYLPLLSCESSVSVKENLDEKTSFTPVITTSMNRLQASNVNFGVCFLLEAVYYSLRIMYSVFSNNF